MHPVRSAAGNREPGPGTQSEGSCGRRSARGPANGPGDCGMLHRSEPRCSQANAESVSKQEFMSFAASGIQLTRRGDPIHSKYEKGLQIREVRRLFPNPETAWHTAAPIGTDRRPPTDRRCRSEPRPERRPRSRSASRSGPRSCRRPGPREAREAREVRRSQASRDSRARDARTKAKAGRSDRAVDAAEAGGMGPASPTFPTRGSDDGWPSLRAGVRTSACADGCDPPASAPYERPEPPGRPGDARRRLERRSLRVCRPFCDPAADGSARPRVSRAAWSVPLSAPGAGPDARWAAAHRCPIGSAAVSGPWTGGDHRADATPGGPGSRAAHALQDPRGRGWDDCSTPQKSAGRDDEETAQ